MSNSTNPRGGLVQPNSKHSFRVKYRGGFIDTSESYLDFMQNMISVDLDLVAKQITLVCRDDILALVSQHIAKMLKLAESDICIEHLSNYAEAVSVKSFSGCKATSHTYKLDYAEGSVATHTLVFSYYDFRTYLARKPIDPAEEFDPVI